MQLRRQAEALLTMLRTICTSPGIVLQNLIVQLMIRIELPGKDSTHTVHTVGPQRDKFLINNSLIDLSKAAIAVSNFLEAATFLRLGEMSLHVRNSGTKRMQAFRSSMNYLWPMYPLCLIFLQADISSAMLKIRASSLRPALQ